MDLKKEIKLSDLVRRPQQKTRAGAEPSGAPQAGAEAGDRRSQDRRLPDRSLARGQQRPGGARAARAHPARAGHRRRRRGARPSRARFGARRVLPHPQASSARRPPRHRHEPDRRAVVRTGGDRGRAPARERDPLPRVRGGLDPGQRGGARLPRRLRERRRGRQRSRRVVLAAAYRDSIDRYVAACKEAGIEVAVVDLEAFALLRAVAPAAVRDEQAAVVAVTIGHDRTTLAISDGVVCDFTRVLEWGGANLEDAIARELDLSADEARQLMLALDLGDDASDGDDARSCRARSARPRAADARA